MHPRAIANILVNSGLAKVAFVLYTLLLMWEIFRSIKTPNEMLYKNI